MRLWGLFPASHGLQNAEMTFFFQIETIVITKGDKSKLNKI